VRLKMQGSERSAREQSILMSLWGALLGQVTPNMRAIFVDWNETFLCVYFVYDGAFTEEEKEAAECIGSEVCADFFDSEFDLQCNRIDYPQPISCPGKCVFMRKEPVVRK